MNCVIFYVPSFHHKLKGGREGSGWKINLIMQHKLVVSESVPCEGSSYIPLSKEIPNSL